MNPLIREIQAYRHSCLDQSEWLEEIERLDNKGIVSPLSPASLTRRKELFGEIAQSEYQKVRDYVDAPFQFSKKLRELEQAQKTLKRILVILPSTDKARIKAKFAELPSEYRKLLYRVIWLNDCLKNKALPSQNYGKSQIEQDPHILGHAREGIIDFCGRSLIEQFLHVVEYRLNIERQSECLAILRKIEFLCEQQEPDKIAILQEYSKLPKKVQSKIAIDIPYALSSGINVLEQNPLILLQLFHPQSTAHESLLKFHLRREREFLERCHKVHDLFTFEKLALFRSMSYQATHWQEKDWIVLKAAISHRKQEWLLKLEKLFESRIGKFRVSFLKEGLYKRRGAHYKKGVTTFRVFAPNAQSVSVVLTKDGKDARVLKMNKKEDGIWEIRSRLTRPGQTYLYLVCDCQGKKMLRIDPFSFSLKQPQNSKVVHSVVEYDDAYIWNDQKWIEQRTKQNPLKKPMAIYELQLKSWMKDKENRLLNYRELAPYLIAYCKKMGFSHLEFYGILEHYYPLSRGYHVMNYFAPYRKLGSADDFKYLVDQLHQQGIGVLIDWIPAHYHHRHVPEGSNERSKDMDGYSESIFEFDGTDLFGAERTPWGTRFLDFEKEEARRYMEASAEYWIKEMHVDGLRIDAVSAIVLRKKKTISSGVSFLQEINNKIHAEYPGVFTIAEETDGFPKVTKPVSEGGLGFDLKWGISWSFKTRDYLRTPYHKRSKKEYHNKIVGFLHHIKKGEKLILTHSHDDSEGGRTMNTKTLYSITSHAKDDVSKFSDLRNFFAWQILAPSRGHLIHMGDELAQPHSWYHRLHKNQSSFAWELIEDSNAKFHHGLQTCVKDLEKLYRAKAAFWQSGEEGFAMIKDDRKNGIIAYRRGNKEKRELVVLHNFSNKDHDVYDLVTGSKKTLKLIFNSDDPKYSGRDKFPRPIRESIRSKNGTVSIRISIPALSTLLLEETS